VSESALDKLIRLTQVVVPAHVRVNPKTGKTENVDTYTYQRHGHGHALTPAVPRRATKAQLKAGPRRKSSSGAKVATYSAPETQDWLARHPVNAGNVVAMYDQATQGEKDTGRDWYPNAHKIANVMAQTWGVPPREAAGMIAAYSPQTAWGKNLMEADEVLRTKQPIGGPGAHLSIVRTPAELQETRYGVMASGLNRTRAAGVLSGTDFEDVFAGKRNKSGALPPKALKIRAFGELISRGGQNPAQEVPDVVIDRHAAGVARGVRFTEDDYKYDGPSTSRKKYEAYATAYRDAAKLLSIREGRDIPPEELQATTWLARQRLNMAEVKARKKLGGHDVEDSLNYFASYEPTVADIIDDPMVGYAELHPDPKVRQLAKDLKAHAVVAAPETPLQKVLRHATT
jgi:hypothetical protein